MNHGKHFRFYQKTNVDNQALGNNLICRNNRQKFKSPYSKLVTLVQLIIYKNIILLNTQSNEYNRSNLKRLLKVNSVFRIGLGIAVCDKVAWISNIVNGRVIVLFSVFWCWESYSPISNHILLCQHFALVNAFKTIYVWWNT